MTLVDLLYSLPPRRALALVIGVSIVFYSVAANFAWANRQEPFGVFERLTRRPRLYWAWRAVTEAGRWLYYLGLPYMTLLLGYDTVRALGVWNLDWLNPLLWTVVIAIGSSAVLIWVWRPFARTEHVNAVDSSRWNWARRILELIYQEAHWAFYRSGPILWLNDYYWGSFLGLGLALIEGWCNPNVRGSVQDTARADAPLWTGSVAVVTTILFIFTQNLWYCLALHLFLDQGLRVAIGFPRFTTGYSAAELDPINAEQE